MATPQPTPVVRLTKEAYSALESQVCPAIVVNQTTTDLMAGTQLGIQLVLKKLREGFVTGL